MLDLPIRALEPPMSLPPIVRSMVAALGLVLATACTGTGQPPAAAPSGSAPARPAATGAPSLAAGGAQPTAGAAQAPRAATVKVAETAAIAYAPVYVAQARGYYSE